MMKEMNIVLIPSPRNLLFMLPKAPVLPVRYHCPIEISRISIVMPIKKQVLSHMVLEMHRPQIHSLVLGTAICCWLRLPKRTLPIWIPSWTNSHSSKVCQQHEPKLACNRQCTGDAWKENHLPSSDSCHTVDQCKVYIMKTALVRR